MFKKNKGITIIELIVSIAIIAMIMAVVIYNSKTLNERIALNSVAQELSLVTRKAQAYGVSVRGDGSDFGYAYGIAFNVNEPDAVYIYADRNSNRLYNGGVNCQNECVEKITLRNNIRVTSICAFSGSVLNCSSISKAHINFLRPNPEPILKVTNSSDSELYSGAFEIRVTLSNSLNNTKILNINSLGKISVQ